MANNNWFIQLIVQGDILANNFEQFLKRLWSKLGSLAV
jgi:hypothetical protein